jgi:hypothetical protein
MRLSVTGGNLPHPTKSDAWNRTNCTAFVASLSDCSASFPDDMTELIVRNVCPAQHGGNQLIFSDHPVSMLD